MAITSGFNENLLKGIINRILQLISRVGPGGASLRIILNRIRGVKIGNNCWIGYDTIIETSSPQLVQIGNNVILGMRVSIIAHYHNTKGVIIKDNAFIGPGAMILPNVTIGHGAVVTAGSVVSTSVPPYMMVQGNPARKIAKCTISLGLNTPMQEFYRGLKPIKSIKVR